MHRYSPTTLGVYGGWEKYEGNPIIGGEQGETFDATVLKLPDRYRMYLSWRTMHSIAYTESRDGIHWKPIETVLEADRQSGWQDDVNRQTVLIRDGKYYMWFAGQCAANELFGGKDATSLIGFATSDDGVQWNMYPDPVLIPTQQWEIRCLMCPHVLWSEDTGKFRMWYSAGEFFEPDAIGYAESVDGIHWEKFAGNPVYTPNPHHFWEREKVAACQVFPFDGWYYMFYIGYEDIHKATISCARSPDGITNWQSHPQNPLITCGPAGSWDAEAIYKPFLLHEDGRWLLWYNGNTRGVEHIGLAFHEGDDFCF